MGREVIVSDMMRRKVLAGGAACERWLADLGDLIAGLEDDWDVSVGAVLEGGTAAFVAEAVRADGTPAVVKIAMPAEQDGLLELETEVRALLLADGRGCVRVLEHDAARGAALLERLGRQLIAVGLPVADQMRIICRCLAEVWTVSGAEALPPLDRKGQWLAEFITSTWEALDRPCSARVVDIAASYAARRVAAFDPDRAVLVHGDAHQWNTLEDPAAGPGAFRLVDPDGLFGEPEYDLAIIMREFNGELLAGDALQIGLERARFLAQHTGFDEQKIWEWGFVERVSTGLLCLQEGHMQWGRDGLQLAERWSAVS